MMAKIVDLKYQPFGFPKVSDKRPVRSKRIMSHRVFYFVDETTMTVHIIDIVHTSRDSRLATNGDS